RYEYDPKNENQIIGIPISKKPHWIMNTINRTLEWPVAGHPEKIVKFDLVRAKVQFEYTYMKDNEPHRKPIGGELIDVSFPNRIDFRLTNFLKNYPQWIATYRLTLKETGESLIMKAESVAGLSADIYEIMFGQFDRPWGDPKYQKRLNRLFFLSIVDMLSTIGLGSKDANEYANSVQQQVVDPLKNLFPLDGQSTAKAKEVSRAAQNIMKKYPQMGVTNKILWGTVKLVFDEMIKNPGDDDEEKFKEYLELIQKNLDIIKKLAEMPPQTIDARQIYNASMSSFF
ncbi:MAG TPA: hypothetical protein VEL47_01870, partial [Myxococcota bacterium]|nr:hypothetical protein [Myxococcota bacterium]